MAALSAAANSATTRNLYYSPTRSPSLRPPAVPGVVRWLATASWDRTARLWNLRLDELMDLACQVAGRNFSRVEWDQYFRGQPYRKTCETLSPGVGVEDAVR